jgi:hypothetical protein
MSTVVDGGMVRLNGGWIVDKYRLRCVLTFLLRSRVHPLSHCPLTHSQCSQCSIRPRPLRLVHHVHIHTHIVLVHCTSIPSSHHHLHLSTNPSPPIAVYTRTAWVIHAVSPAQSTPPPTPRLALVVPLTRFTLLVLIILFSTRSLHPH